VRASFTRSASPRKSSVQNGAEAKPPGTKAARSATLSGFQRGSAPDHPRITFGGEHGSAVNKMADEAAAGSKAQRHEPNLLGIRNRAG